MKRIALLFLCCFCCLARTNGVMAQLKRTGVNEDFFEKSSGIKSLQLNDNLLAFVSNSDNKAVEISGTDINTTKKWSTTVDGYLHEAAVVGDNILLLVSTDFTIFARGNSIFKAYLISSDKGTVLTEKVLFNGNNEYFTLPYILVSNNKKTITLATMETSMKRNLKVGLGFVGTLYTIKKMSTEAHEIRAFKVLSFDEKLNEMSAISLQIPEGDFIGIQKTINDDLYVAVANNKEGITISKFLPNTEKPTKSITESFSFNGGILGVGRLSDQVKLYADTVHNSGVYLTGSFKNDDEFISVFNRYDFSGDKHQYFRKSFSKDEVKSIEKSYVPINKDFKKLEFGQNKQLEIVNVLLHDTGCFVIVSDHTVTQLANGPPVLSSGGLIVYSLDKNFALRSTTTIPRSYGGMAMSSLTGRLANDYLYLLTTHHGNAGFLTAKINTSSGKLEDIEHLKVENAKVNDYTSLADTIIINKKIIVPVSGQQKAKNNIHLYQFSW